MTPSDRSPTQAPGDALGFVFNHLSHAMTREFELEISRFDVRTVHLSVMSILRSAGPCTQQHLADRLGLRRSTMVRVVRELVERGYVERDLRDGRSYRVSLTAAGRSFHDELDAFATGYERRAFAPLSLREQATLLRLLRKLATGGAFPRMSAEPDHGATAS